MSQDTETIETLIHEGNNMSTKTKARKITQRKTVSVRKVLDSCNNVLKYDFGFGTQFKDKTAEEAYRLGVASVLDLILHDTGNYAGYTHLDQAMGVVNGVNTVIVKDDTRRCYCYSKAMREEE